MLVGLRLRHFASKRHPERESRLLYMTTNPGANPNPPQNPNAAPNAQQNTPDPNAQNAPQQNADATRQQVNRTLQPRAADMHASVEGTINDLRSQGQKILRVLEQAAGVREIVERQLSGQQLQEWRACLLDTEMMHASITTAERELSAVNASMQAWETLRMPPGQYLTFLQGIWPQGGSPDQQAARQTVVDPVEAYLRQKSQSLTQELGTPIDLIADGRPWEGGLINASQRVEIQQEINRLLDASDAKNLLTQVNGIGEHIAALSAGRVDIDQMSEFVKLVRKNAAEEAALAETGVIQGGSGWKLYSIMDIYEGAKSVIESYKRTWNQHRQLASANVAKRLGKFISWLPYGDEVQQVLDSELKGKNDEVKDKYLNFLKTQNMTFPQVFGDNGELFRVKSDPNLSRAVLEYAASRGWLYNIDEIGVDGKILGMFQLQSLASDYERHELDNYFQKLREENRNGGKSEKDRIKSRENKDAFPDFLVALQEQFRDQNLWGVVGVMERAIERGLSDVVVTRMAVEFMRQLRDNPEVASYFGNNRDLIDQIGALSMYNTAFTLGWFKQNRRDIQKWLKERRYNPNADMREAGPLFQVADVIERNIRRQLGDAAFERMRQEKRLDDVVAKILTGQLVYTDAEGKMVDQARATAAFSLFDPDYDFYRNDKYITTFHNVNKPFDEDTDYYTEDTEQILMNSSNVKTILEFTSTRAMKDETRGTSLMAKFLKQEEKLRKTRHVSPEIHEYFLLHSQNSLTEFWKNYLNDAPLSKTYPSLTGPNNKPLFAELIARKLINIQVFYGEPKAACSKEFFRQLLDDGPNAPFGPRNLQSEFGWTPEEIQALRDAQAAGAAGGTPRGAGQQQNPQGPAPAGD